MNEIISVFSEELGVSTGLTIAYIIVGILIIIMAIVALVMKIIVWARYAKANKIPSSVQMSGLDAAQYVLDREGMSPEVKVRKSGFIREAIFGNYYNILTKTIYLRSVFGKIDSKKSVTSIALAVQKVAIAKLCESGDKQARTRNSLSLLGVFGPFLLIPLILIGGILDFVVLNTGGLISVICLAVSGILTVLGFVVTFLNIPVERRANEMAVELMYKHGLATDAEVETIKKVYDAYITSYICDFILELLRVIQWILEIFIKMQSNK